MSPTPPPNFSGAHCPTALGRHEAVQLAHGGGGRLSQQLIESVFLSAFQDPALAELHDGALVELPPGRLAFSTDSYVVQPLFFPGGNIGSLSVHGTVNDLAMCGARPLFLSTGFIIEEGFPFADLHQIVRSMAAAARACGVRIVTGDTKVVDRGKGDGVFINTAGVGHVPAERNVNPRRATPSDVVLVSGELAAHGIAIMSQREGLQFESSIESDSAAVSPLVEALFEHLPADAVHVLRDPTRGGVASALNEIATSSNVGILLREDALPIRPDVQGACELLGFDPLYVANEGKCVAIVESAFADRALGVWRASPLGRQAAVIGEVTSGPKRVVELQSRVGTRRVVDMLSGEQLPRIC